MTLPGYIALLLHTPSTGASEHFQIRVGTRMGAKYV